MSNFFWKNLVSTSLSPAAFKSSRREVVNINGKKWEDLQEGRLAGRKASEKPEDTQKGEIGGSFCVNPGTWQEAQE